MAQLYYNGPGALWPHTAVINTNTLGTSQIQIDASNELGAVVGPVWWPEDGDTTKNLTHIGWRSGAIVHGGASQWRLSVQNISTTTSPMQPDGAVDQHYTPAAGVAATNNGWNRNALDTSRTVTRGDLIALVWEFLTFTGGDILRVAGGFTSSTLYRPLQTDLLFHNGTSWAGVGATVIAVLEFDDGSFGTLYGSFPHTNSAVGGFNNATTGGTGFTAGDERGAEITVPFPLTIEGIWGELSIAGNSSDFDIVLYEGTTALNTISVDATQITVTGGNRRFVLPLPAVRVLKPTSTYRIMIKPTTANNVAVQNFTVDDADHRVLIGGSVVAGVTREDGGSFSSPITTVVPLLGFVLAGGDGGGRSGVAQQVTGSGRW